MRVSTEDITDAKEAARDTEASGPVPSVDAAAMGASDGIWRRWTLILLLSGIVWRLVRYGLQFPFWQDEAKRALNLLDRPLLDAHPSLLYDQLQPPLFVMATQVLRGIFSSGEWVFRILPLLAGVAALGLFYSFARRILNPLACAVAVGLMAASAFTVQFSTEFKPYSVDLLLAVLYLTVAWQVLQSPSRLRYLVVLVLLMPISVGLSYASVFLIGTVSAVLVVSVFRKMAWPGRILFVLANGLALAALILLVRQVESPEFRATSNTMASYWWQRSFPPANPWRFIIWIFQVHLGAMNAYPIKAFNLCACVICGLGVVGIYRLVAARNYRLLALLLGPFILTFLAACVRRYPYGGEARVAQHMLPGMLIFTGLGLSWVFERGRARAKGWGERQVRWVGGVLFALLLCVPMVGMARDIIRPYYYWPYDVAARTEAQKLGEGFAELPLFAGSPETAPPVFIWYVRRHSSRLYFGDSAGGVLVPTASTGPVPARFLELESAVTGGAPLLSGWRREAVAEYTERGPDGVMRTYRIFLCQAGVDGPH